MRYLFGFVGALALGLALMAGCRDPTRVGATPPGLVLPPHSAGGRHSRDHDRIKSFW